MQNNGRKNTLYTAFFIYITVMLYLLFFRRMSNYTEIPYNEYIKLYTNFVPMATLRRFFWLLTKYDAELAKIAVINLAGNILLFVPLGIFLPEIWPKQRKIWIFLPTAALSISIVEALQLAARLGSCDIDDLILNLAGALTGFLVRIVKK